MILCLSKDLENSIAQLKTGKLNDYKFFYIFYFSYTHTHAHAKRVERKYSIL